MHFVLFGLCCQQGFTQNRLSGKFIGGNKQGVPYLEVTASRGDTISSGTVTDTSGAFTLNLPDGTYRLKANLFGKKAYEKRLVVKRNLDLDVMQINTDMQMKEVGIRIRKRLIKVEGDKLIMNVKGNALLDGKNTLEILRYAPSVKINGLTGKISMRGKPTTILIDGKKANMSAAELNDFLTSLSNEEVASIEVISNPGSQYDAAGSGGVINIITAKAKKNGLKASIRTYVRVSPFLLQRNSINLNTKLSERLSFHNAVNLNRGDEPGEEDRTERLLSPFIDYSYKRKYRAKSSYFQTANSLYYKLDPNSEFGLDFSYSTLAVNQSDRKDVTITDTKKAFSAGDYRFKRDNHYYNIGFNYKLKLDSSGQELKAILDYYQSDYQARDTYKNHFFDNNHNPTGSNERRAHLPTHNKILSGQLDYEKPFKKSSLKAGLKYGTVSNRNSTLFENEVDGSFTPDDSLTNAFHYKEQIFAAYTSLSIDSLFNGGISAQIGLRGEYTRGKGEIPDKDYNLKKNYIDLFPSFSLNKSFDDKRSVHFSYSRRIERPNYNSFNPTIFYITEFSSAVGNPELAPSYTHALELSYSAARCNASLYYNRTQSEQGEILKKTSSKTSQTQWRNIDHADVYGLSVSGNKKLSERLDLFAKASWYGKYYQSSFTDQVDNLDRSKDTFQGRLTLAYTLPFGVHGDASFQYTSPEIYGQFELEEYYTSYATLSKKLDNGLSFHLKVVDPFDKTRYRFKTMLSEIITTQVRNTYSQAVSLSVVYDFNMGSKTKNIKIENSNAELRSRTN